jgi:hypothetical protein
MKTMLGQRDSPEKRTENEAVNAMQRGRRLLIISEEIQMFAF